MATYWGEKKYASSVKYWKIYDRLSLYCACHITDWLKLLIRIVTILHPGFLFIIYSSNISTHSLLFHSFPPFILNFLFCFLVFLLALLAFLQLSAIFSELLNIVFTNQQQGPHSQSNRKSFTFTDIFVTHFVFF